MRKIILFIVINFLFGLSISAQNTEWVVSWGGANSDKGISIGTDTFGFIYASGYFNTSATFGTITLSNSPASGTNKEAFVVKMDSAGNVIWALSGGDGTGSCCDDRALGMHVTPDGFVYLTGTFWSSFNIGTCSISFSGANSHDSSLLTKIDPNGNCVWARSFGADAGAGSGPDCPYPIYDADDHSYDVKVDGAGFIYITGFFSGISAEFDAISLTNPNWGANCTPLGYVAKLDDSGNFIWAHKFDGIEDPRGSRDNRIAIDHFSNVYVTGGFENVGTYGPHTLTSVGDWDVFLFKMDSDGNFIWARNVGSNKDDRGDGIAIDYCDNIYISGEYRNPMVFVGANASNGTDTLSHKKKRDVFVAKITTNGDWVWAKRARSSGVDKPYQMSVDEDMQVFVSGSAGDSLKFNNNIVLSNNDTTLSAFVAQLDGSGTGDWVWAKLGGGPTDDDDRANDICEDGKGNLYAIGFYEFTADFDGNSLNSLGKKDVFVWKLKKAPVVPTPSHCIYVDVQPAGSGYINMNGTDVTLFPCLQNLSDSAMQSFIATPNVGYTFSDWDWKIHTALPDTANPNSSVFTYSDDTLIVNFQAIQYDTIVYVVQPVGGGTATIDGVTISAFPHTEIYTEGDTSNLLANANSGFGFTNWTMAGNTPMPNNTSVNIEVIWSNNDTVFINFDTIPTADVTYIVNPAGSGTITVDGVPISTFPYNANYPIGQTSNLTAIPNAGFNFVNWDFQNNIPLPNMNASAISTTWQNDDTVYVNFSAIPSYAITYLTNPVGAGTIDINTVNQAIFPYTESYLQGTNVTLEAFENPNFTFKNWTSNSNALNPSNLSQIADFNAFSQDTIIAHYDEVDTLWILTQPAGTAELMVDVDFITTTPFMGIYQIGSVLDITATPTNSNVFNQWDLIPAALPDFNPITSFIFTGQDTLIASLNNVLGVQSLGDDISSLTLYPTMVNNQFTLEMNLVSTVRLQVELLNISGQVIEQLYTQENEQAGLFQKSFPVDLSAGMYFVRIQTDHSNVVLKLIKI